MLSTRLFDGLKSTLGLGRRRAPRRPARNALTARRLRHEPLEDRRLLSVDPGWAFSLGNTGSDFAEDIAVDAAGNVYMTGYFTDTVDFDPSESEALLSSTSGRSFVASYSSAGELNWAKQFNCKSHDITTNGVDVYGCLPDLRVQLPRGCVEPAVRLQISAHAIY